jgi:hypothetical protein
MAAGLSTANLIAAWLGTLSGTAIATDAVRSTHMQPHTGDPGAAGTANVFSSVVTPRAAMTWAAAVANARSLAATLPSWTATGAGTVTHVSCWDASTSGNFRMSAALSASKTLATDDLLNITNFTVTVTPVAA